MLTAAEVLGASLVSALASVVVASYLADRVGLPMAPLPLLLVAAAFAVGTRGLTSLSRRRQRDATDVLVFASIVVAAWASLLYAARPWLLPQGGGPDLTHHLLLIGYIEQHWRLVHDPAVEMYLGEMVHYTPGSHVLAAAAGALARTDGLHAVHAVVSFAFALKAAFVYLIARRVARADGAAAAAAGLAAVLLLLIPAPFTLGAFLHDSYFSQVVAELFVVAMWWALVVWDDSPSAAPIAIVALTGAAAFLSWPVFTGPVLLALPFVVASRRDVSARVKVAHLAVAAVPVAIVAAVYIAGRAGWMLIVRTSGAVLRPAPRELGWIFVAAAIAGAATAVRDRRARVTLWLLGASAIQAAALWILAKRNGADTPYMALKMTYLAIYPLAVLGACALARVMRRPAAAWTVVGVLALASTRGLQTMTRSKPLITEPLVDASRWARTHVDSACVDYLVSEEYTAYWLHLGALGNRRMSARTGDNDTFDPKKAIVRWILPDGLPVAIAEDFDALPRDIRDNVDVLARFPPAAVIRRRGAAHCGQ